MMKPILIGAVAVMLMTGAAYAQDSESVTREKTVVQAPDGDRSVDTHTTVRKDDDGDVSVTKRTTDVNRDDGDVSKSTTVQKTTVDR